MKINAIKASYVLPYNGHVFVDWLVWPVWLLLLPCDLVINETLLQRVGETLVHERVADEGPSFPQ